MLSFERRVALRFLREGRMQSLLIVVGVAAGVAVVTYISALIGGLQASTLEKTLGAQAHVTIRLRDDTPRLDVAPGALALDRVQPREQRLRSLAGWPALMHDLEQRPGVAAVSPMVSTVGLGLRGSASASVALVGVDLDRYDRIVRLRDKVVAGTARLAPGEAILGQTLAADLALGLGDRFTVRTGTVDTTLRVTALVDLGVRELNRRTVYLPLRSAQSLAGLPGGATSLDLRLDDVWAAGALAARLSAQLQGEPEGLEVEGWQQANAQLVSALNAQSVSTGIIRGVVGIVVVLGIASVLVVSVVQKQREIGILRAMGATRAQVQRVFLLQGAVVGALGSVLGVALAWALIWAFTHFVKGSDGLPLFSIALPPLLALQVALAATVAGVLAAVAPARRAAALDPARAIRL